jgi:hypothetical protein
MINMMCEEGVYSPRDSLKQPQLKEVRGTLIGIRSAWQRTLGLLDKDHKIGPIGRLWSSYSPVLEKQQYNLSPYLGAARALKERKILNPRKKKRQSIRDLARRNPDQHPLKKVSISFVGSGGIRRLKEFTYNRNPPLCKYRWNFMLE